MKIRNLFIALFIFFGSSVYAQSFYEMKFYFKNSDDPKDILRFNAFFLLNDDGTGEMRISIKGAVPKDDIILEGDLTQGFAKDKNKEYNYSKMYYTGKKFTIVTGDIEDQIPPFTFWFKHNEATDEYDPWAVMTKDLEGKDLQGVIEGHPRLLGDADLTKNFILTYFTKDEEIYKNLFAANIRVLTPEQKKSRMFLLVVADTDDEQIGPDCQKDREKQMAYFKKIAGKLEISFIPLELTGKDLSRKNLLAKIDEIKPTKNDIVIFHFSGHGYSKDGDNRQYPYLDLRYDKDIPVNLADEINMEEVYALITNKPGRLNLV